MTIVGPLLPVVALPAIWYLSYGFRAGLGLDRLSRRGCLVVAFIVLQALVAVISEGVSLGRQFTPSAVFVAWLAVDLLAVTAAVLLFRRGPGLRVRLRHYLAAARATSGWERVLAGLGAAWFGVLVAIACLYSVPTNGDSLVYHLTRVAHWVQNGSVHHYPSHYAAQNELAPLHEYNMAHLHLLAGTERLDGFVQLLAVLVCVAGASEIARLLGGGRNAQLLAAGFTATIPSLILEATSTQNNDFAAATGVGVLVALLAWRPAGRYVIGAALIGAAVATGVLAKGTMVLFIATTGLVLLAAAIAAAREAGPAALTRRVALAGAVAAAVAVVLAGPFFARNERVYDGLTGPTSRTTLSYDLTPQAAAANVIRSVAANFQIGDGTGVESALGRTVLGALHGLYRPLGVDPQDWRYMVGSNGDAFSPIDYSGWQRNEAIGANPWHVVIILVALVLLTVLVIRGDRRLRVPLLLGLALVATFLIFSAVTRWSIYGVRYQVPVLVAWCPLIALLAERARRAIGAVLLVVLLVLAGPALLDSVSRSLLHPAWNEGSGIEPYFRIGDPGLAPLHAIADGEQAAAELIAGTSCTAVGLANWVQFEYPIWVALHNEHWRGRIEAVDVPDPSGRLADPGYAPCALIRQVEPGYVTADPKMVSVQFGPIALSLAPELVGEDVPDQRGFHSEVAGVRVRPGSGWILDAGAPKVGGPPKIWVISDAGRTVRVRTTDSTGAAVLETTMELIPGPNPLELPEAAAAITAVSVLPV